MKIDVFNYSERNDDRYDLLIYAVGYEERSRYVASRLHNRSDLKLGYVFNDGHILSFADNRKYLSEIKGNELAQGEGLVRKLMEIAPQKKFQNTKVCLDVSSLNRGAMAALFSELLDDEYFSGAQITVQYAVASYQPPISESVDFVDFGPLAGFEGWTSSPELPVVLFLGLGYDSDHAIGAVEYLDPSATYSFFPIGYDTRFEKSVEKANDELLAIVNQSRVIRYPVMSPYQTFWEMQILLNSLRKVARVVAVPMGPKIFCSLCLVRQRMFGEELSIWRASGHTLGGARDAKAEGQIVGYNIKRGE